MNRESPNQDSKVLQILDDIERVKSSREFSQDSLSEMLKSVEWEALVGDGESTNRSVSNDSVQAYLGKAVDDAVHCFLGPAMNTAAGASHSCEEPEQLQDGEPEPLMAGREGHKLAGAGETHPAGGALALRGGSLRWLSSNDSEEGPTPPSPISRSQSVTPIPSDDEHEEIENTIAKDKSQEKTKVVPTSAPSAFFSIPPNPQRQHDATRPPERSAAFRDEDVLFGRGGLSNHHAGNKRYREEVDRIKPEYRQEHLTKKQKTEIRNRLVDTVRGYGGRFLRYSQKDGWEEAPLQLARKKASQALREEKRKGGNI